MVALIKLNCPDCEGTGAIEANPLNSFFDFQCPYCDGTGLVQHTDIYIDSRKEAELEYGEKELVDCDILTTNEEK